MLFGRGAHLTCAVSGEELAAEAQISAAMRRAVEVRAEAAMLVEAVEDRAYSVSASPKAPLWKQLACAHCISLACHAYWAIANVPLWWCLWCLLRDLLSAVPALWVLLGTFKRLSGIIQCLCHMLIVTDLILSSARTSAVSASIACSQVA